MLKLENSIRGLSFSRVAFDLTIQDIKNHTPWVWEIHLGLVIDCSLILLAQGGEF